MKHLLLTNDDGFYAEGIQVLKNALAGLGEAVIVAPDREMSGASHSVTFHRPLRMDEVKPGVYKVDGTPTDCVFLAVKGNGIPEPPDVLVSGINKGPNIGDDVTYSGTVAAAIEGTLLGIPSIAVSLDGTGHFETAAAVIPGIVERVLDEGLPAGTLLNVNVPDIPLSDLRGLRVTHQSHRQYDDQVTRRIDPRGRPYYWIAGEVVSRDAQEDSDFAAVQDGYVSITPLQLDLTDHRVLETMGSWNTDM